MDNQNRDCGMQTNPQTQTAAGKPSVDQWLEEIKRTPAADQIFITGLSVPQRADRYAKGI